MRNNVIRINRLLKKSEGKTNTPAKQATTAFERWIDKVITLKKTANSTSYSESVTNKNYGILMLTIVSHVNNVKFAYKYSRFIINPSNM